MRHTPALWVLVFLALAGAAGASAPDYQSQHYALGLAPTAPRVSCFAVDSLGQGRLAQNPVLEETAADSGLRLRTAAPGRFVYELPAPAAPPAAAWQIACAEKTLTLRSDYAAGKNVPPLALAFNQKSNHATLLGRMQPGERRMELPCVLHLPDMGTLRITCNVPGWKLDYDARRGVRPPWVRIGFPPATAEHPQVEYRLEVVCIYPPLPGVENDRRFDGFRRDWLNIFQVNARVQMLANNASSDPCAFTLFEYAEMAPHTPPLAEGLTCLDLVRMTLDRYLAGALGYGQIGYGSGPHDDHTAPWNTPWTSSDSFPSLIISACIYIQGAQDWSWAGANQDKLSAWARAMLACDRDDHGLIEYPATGNYGDRPRADKRPANWWDTINFGHEDAYSNALSYRACTLWAQVARKLKRNADADFFAARAERLRAAYVPTFLNPATGVLAGWKSADGHLHDYWFTFVSGVAITYGLVDRPAANAIMDRLLRKMGEVGYTNFALGLPGNLVPVRRGDYVDHNTPPQVHGVPRLEDGSDGFQYYENGGATGCFCYFTLKALYQLGRRDDARRILYPMLTGYAAGEFQGFGENGMSKDWRDWHGGCHGYEGLLVDNYLALLAVLDDRAP